MPLSPRLYELLLGALETASPGQAVFCNLTANNLRRDFAVIRRRAGLADWAEPFQVMRRNCEQDWAAAGHPQHAVSTWIGHDITISQRFYLRTSDDLFQRLSHASLPQNPPQMSA